MTTFRDLFGEPVEDASDEPFTYHGEELTDAAAERINQETLAGVCKPLSGDGSTSPKVEFRVSRELLDARSRHRH